VGFLTEEVNFINILNAQFSYESELSSISPFTFGFVIFGAKILYEKRARKSLMKLTVAGSPIDTFITSPSLKL